MKKLKKNNEGFSLVELIIVIAIMAILVGVLAPQYLGHVDKTKQSTDIQNAESLATEIGVKLAEAEVNGTWVDGTTVNWNSVKTSSTDPTTQIFNVTTVPVSKKDKNATFYFKIVNNQVYIAIVPSNASNRDDYMVYPSFGGGAKTIYDKINK